MTPFNFGMPSALSPFDLASGIGSFGAPTMPAAAAAPSYSAAGTGVGTTAAAPAASPAAGAGATVSPWANGLEKFGTLAEGLASLGQLYAAFQGVGIAKDQLAFSKESFNKNLLNQTKSYNTSLEDRIRSRYVTEGRTTGEADSYLASHKL